MARRQNGLIEILLNASARLGWPAGIGIAIVAHLCMRWVAAQKPAASVSTADIGSQVLWSSAASLASALQWLLPVLIVFGVAVGSLRRRKQKHLFAQLRSGSKSLLNDFTWREFEELIAGFFRERGYSVVPNSGNGPDGGIDMELQKDRELFLVQCKHWRARKVPVTTIRELLGVMVVRGAIGGFVVTSGSFTEDARQFAAGRQIELIDGAKLQSLVKRHKTANSGHVHDVADSSAPDCPKCGTLMIRRTAKRGINAGKSFWGCSNFPRCRGTRDIS